MAIVGIILRFCEIAHLTPPPPPPPTETKINTYMQFFLRAKCWLRGGVGGQFPRNVKWSNNNAGDKKSPPSQSRGCHYLCVACMFGLPLRMNGMHRMQFHHACFDLPPLVIWSCVFWPSVSTILCKVLAVLEQKCLILDCCHLHSVTFDYY